ncbi:MAG: sigma-54 dependent transcriptional regulator [Verrucomicrobiota bacterium]
MSTPLSNVLIVDDEPDVCRLLAALVQQDGLVPLVAHDGQGALNLVRSERPRALFLDLKLPDIDGLELLRQIKAWDETIAVVIVTAHAGIASAVEAMRAGANNYLAKPFAHEDILRVLHQALAEAELLWKVKAPPPPERGDADTELTDLQRLMGRSQAIGQLIAKINQVARSPLNVLITGETGSGKELVAQTIHRLSPRAKQAFVPVDCGAVPETLFEGELLGHEKGAFTGAVNLRTGKLELAHGGTLFLDEILNTPPGCQAKLLRALQERSFTRLGGTKAIQIDVRVLAACGVDLETEVRAGRFRADLFYRLCEFSLRIPALRERTEDILYLAERFLGLANQELKKRVKGFSGAAVEALQAHAWPGNVRELRSTIRRAVLLADKNVTGKHLDFMGNGHWELAKTPAVRPVCQPGRPGPSASRAGPPAAARAGPIPLKDDSLKEAVSRSTAAAECEMLRHMLIRTGGNKAAAARLLKIDYKTIQTKVRKYGLAP